MTTLKSLTDSHVEKLIDLKTADNIEIKSPANSPRNKSKRKRSSERSNINFADNNEIITERKVSQKKISLVLNNDMALSKISDLGGTKAYSENVPLRLDFYGNEIKKGKGKKQKISFIDKISNFDFTEVVEIESFKKFNIDTSKGKVKCECSACCIF